MPHRAHVASPSRVISSAVPANRITRLVSTAQAADGRPLPGATRAGLERSLNTNLSSVRIHTGAASDTAARAVSARAFTIGNDIHFKSGEYNPSSAAGFHLVAHEAVHTVTHGGAARRGPAEHVQISSPEDRAERQATAAASAIVAGRHARVARSTGTDSGAPRLFRDRDRTKSEGDQVAEELKTLIGGATWKAIRHRVYPKESAAGITRASERKAGTRADLTGLGRIKNLEHLAGSIRGLQSTWSTLTVDKRIKAVAKAANDELANADVPAFLMSDKVKATFKAAFNPVDWSFILNEALVTGSSLGDADGAELANTTMHESRHAEQEFLAARFQAGVNNKTADQIETEDKIPKVIADKAVKRKFDASTDVTVVDLGRRMFDATVTDRAKNNAITKDDGLKELDQKRIAAQTVLNHLATSKTPDNITDGKTAASELTKQIAVVENRYTDYRNIPYEADAHEVGDAAEQAFKGWPGLAAVQPKAQRTPKNPPQSEREPRGDANP